MASVVQYSRPEVSSLDGLNRLAAKRGWALRCDGQGHYYLPEMADLHAIWRANAGVTPPLRSAMTPRLLKPFLPILTVHERLQGPDGSRCYRVRLMGSESAGEIGDGTGKSYDEFLPSVAVPMWRAMSDAVLAHGGPVRFVMSGEQIDKGTLVGEVFAAPLLTDDGRADLILSAGRFNSLWRWKELLAQWEQDVAVPA
jgi:hypothetical protein